MNVLVTINYKYLFSTKVMLYSLCKNTTEDIHLFVFHSTLTQEHQHDLRIFLSQFSHIKVEFITVDPSIFENLTIYDHFAIECFYRLLAPKYINVDRLLYLDVDLIIHRSIEEFYHLSFLDDQQEYYLIGCEGIGVSHTRYEIYDNIEMDHHYNYMNAGVVLMNLKALRQYYQFEDYIDFIHQHEDRLLYLDQDILNGMFYQFMKFVDWKIYNFTIIHIHNPEEEAYASNNATILHYAGPDKPWNEDYHSWLFDEFWYYGKHVDASLYHKLKIKRTIHKIKKIIKKVLMGK